MSFFIKKNFYIGESISKFSYKAVCIKLYTMLFDNEITESERLDTTEGIDVDHIVCGLLNNVQLLLLLFPKYKL